MDDKAELLPPPPLATPAELTPDALSDAWANGEASGAAIVRALSQKRGVAVPWGLVRESLARAVRSRWLETVRGDGASLDYDRAGEWRLRMPQQDETPPRPRPTDLEVEGFQMQDVADLVPKLLEASAGYDLRFRIGVALATNAPESMRRQIDDLLKEAVPTLQSDG